MIAKSEGMAIVKEAWELANRNMEGRQDFGRPAYFLATGIAAGILQTVLAMATFCEEGAWGEIFKVRRALQDEFLEKFGK